MATTLQEAPVSERERLIDAFTKTATERGYAATGVQEIARRAGLPLASFSAHFKDKRQCLIAAYDAFLERLFDQVLRAMEAELPWPAQVRAAVAAALEFITETASSARLFAVEAQSAGPAVLERYATAIARFVALLRNGRAYRPAGRELPALTEAVLIGGVANIATAKLLAEEYEQLAELEAEIAEVLLAPYLGPSGVSGGVAV